jgi:hypothetical protein
MAIAMAIANANANANANPDYIKYKIYLMNLTAARLRRAALSSFSIHAIFYG